MPIEAEAGCHWPEMLVSDWPAEPSSVGRVLTRAIKDSAAGSDSITRKEISADTGVSDAVVSKVVVAANVRGILRDGKPVAQGRGRPLTPISVNPSKWLVIGIKVTDENALPASIVGVLCRLDGTPIADPISERIEASTVRAEGRPGFISRLSAFVDRMRASAPHRSRILGVGVELGGQVFEGRVILSVNTGIDDRPEHDVLPVGSSTPFDIKGDLEAEIELPVVVHNDVNALAIYETLFGMGERSNFMLVAIYDDGVGGGLVLDNELRTGVRGGAGEIGHIRVDTSNAAEKCRCGLPGHLEQYATPAAIARTLNTSWTQALTREDEASLVAFAKAGRSLGIALATAATLVNPERFVLHLPAELVSPATSAAAAYVHALRETLQFEAFGYAGSVELEICPIEAADVLINGARAAAATVIKRFLDDLGSD